MVQDCLCNLEANAEALEVGRKRAPKIVQAPGLQWLTKLLLYEIVQFLLALGVAGKACPA